MATDPASVVAAPGPAVADIAPNATQTVPAGTSATPGGTPPTRPPLPVFHSVLSPVPEAADELSELDGIVINLGEEELLNLDKF